MNTSTNLRFGHILVMGSKYSATKDTARLFIELTNEHRKLLPKPLSDDIFELSIDAKGNLKGEVFWPGAGRTIALDPKAIAPLIRHGQSSSKLWLGRTPAAYRHFEKALERFSRLVDDHEAE